LTHVINRGASGSPMLITVCSHLANDGLNKLLLLLPCFSGIIGDVGDAIAIATPFPFPGGLPVELANDDGVKEEDMELELVED